MEIDQEDTAQDSTGQDMQYNIMGAEGEDQRTHIHTFNVSLGFRSKLSLINYDWLRLPISFTYTLLITAHSAMIMN